MNIVSDNSQIKTRKFLQLHNHDEPYLQTPRRKRNMNNISFKTVSLCLMVIVIILQFYATINIQTDFAMDTDAFIINIDKNEIEEARTKIPVDQHQTSISSISGDDLSSLSPQIVLLMSFPNSGTSYTLRLVHKTSNKTIGTNYEKEINYGKSIPISSQLSPYGPFMLQDRHMNVPKKDKSQSNDSYHHLILTKTHCAGYCVDCNIREYFIDRYQFQRGCATNRLLPNHHHHHRHHSYINITENNGTNTGSDNKDNHINTKIRTMTRIMGGKSSIYDYRIEPKKVIRLVRDPFNNVVSNFHLWLKQQSQEGTGLDRDFTKDGKGFMEYCHIQNALFKKKFKEEKDVSLKRFFMDLKELLVNVPCHQHFFRYVTVRSSFQIIFEQFYCFLCRFIIVFSLL